MKLSIFFHQICDMIQIVLKSNEDNIDEIVDKIFNLFEKDVMDYNLILHSNIIFFQMNFPIIIQKQ